MTRTGSCLCGEITYELEGEPIATAVCHCEHCQRQSGGAFSVNLVVQQDQVQISGPIKTYEDRGEDGDAVYVKRRFCGNCGSPIVSELMEPAGIVALKAGTLDDHSFVQPEIEAWCVSKQSWVDLPGLTSMEREQILEPQIIVVSGLPGVGKSTTSHELALRFERAAHVEADRLQNLIVAGAAMPGLDGIDSHARLQLDLRLQNACVLARSFVEAGFTAIIDDIVMGSGVEDLTRHLDGVSFTFIMLCPDFAHVKQRWIDMDSPFAERWDWIDDEIRNKTERIGLWLDTTDLDPTQTVDQILEHLPNEP